MHRRMEDKEDRGWNKSMWGVKLRKRFRVWRRGIARRSSGLGGLAGVGCMNCDNAGQEVGFV